MPSAVKSRQYAIGALAFSLMLIFPTASLATTTLSIEKETISATTYKAVSSDSDISDYEITLTDCTFSKSQPYFYGGYSSSGDVSSVSVTLSGTTTLSQRLYIYGGYTTSGTAANNYVTIGELSSSSSSGKIYMTAAGGYSSSGTVSNNTVTVSGTTTTNTTYLYGGSTSTGEATNNYVYVKDGSYLAGSVYGGYSSSTGSTSYNTAYISSSEITGSVFGGYSYKGSANYNSVTVTDSTVASTIVGGETDALSTTNTANNNTVTVSGTTAGTVFGGYAYGGEADKNTVTITSGTFDGYVVGGFNWYNTSSTSATSDGNTVALTASDGSSITVDCHVSGGFTAHGYSASNNTVTVSGSTEVGAAVSGGIVFIGNAVNNNTVNITGGTIHGADVFSYFKQVAVVAAGLYYHNNNQTAEMTGNTVNISGDETKIEGDVYGTYSLDEEATVYGNAVNISGGTITGTVYGARSDGAVSNNSVTITGGTIQSGEVTIKKVEGDFSSYDLDDYDTTLYSAVYGGYSDGGYLDVSYSVTGNSVTISDAIIQCDVYAGYSVTGDATDNVVNLAGNATISGNVFGGYSESETADISGNSLTVSGVDNTANGIYGFSSAAFDLSGLSADETMLKVTESVDLTEVSVTLSNATDVSLNPGESATVISSDESLTLATIKYITDEIDYDDDSTLSYDIADLNYSLSDTGSSSSELTGTYELTLSISETSLDLNAGTDISVSSVTLDLSAIEWGTPVLELERGLSYYFSGLGSEDISLSDAVISTDEFLNVEDSSPLIVIGDAYAYDLSALEELNSSYAYSLADGAVDITGKGYTVTSSSGLDYKISSVDTMDFTISEDMDISSPIITVTDADLSGAKITVTAYTASSTDPAKGYSVTLVEASGSISTDGTTYSGTLIEGVSIEYELEFEVDDQTIVAYYDAETDGSIRNETKSLVETRLGQSAMVEQGQDHISNALDSAASLTGSGLKWVPFVTIGASSLSYDTGSSVDIDGFNSAVGFLRKLDTPSGNLVIGATFQYGRGEYDSYAEGVSASGDTDYVGGAAMAKHTWDSGHYVEGSVSAGYSQADYESSSLLAGSITTYDVGAEYWGLHVGVGRVYDLSHGKSLDAYAKYFFSHLSSSSAAISSGETYSFDSVDSSRIRIGARFSRRVWDNGGYYFGAAYQYQFDDEARATYKGFSTLSPSLQGSSGMLEAGMKFSPKNINLTADIGAKGWVGKQKGVEGALKLKWEF